jgi:tetratricopeptide (TPR) repeat protein
MKKNYKTLIILFSAINVFAQNNVIDKTSNNLTLDGNVEFIDKNLIQAESFYRKAISKDSLNNIASYNMANSFYKSGFNKEAINEYKSSIVKAKSKEDLHKSFHNLGDAFMKNKDYQNAVNAFKKALLNKPSDDETRYNYALAKELLKNEQKNKKKDDKNKDKNKDDKKKDDKNKDKNKDDKNKDKNKDDKKKDEKKEDKNGDKKKEEKNDETKENKPKPNQISPEQLKNLLKAMNNEEKKVQEKVNKNKIKGKPVKNKKDW